VTAPTETTRLVFGDALQAGTVMVQTCKGERCYPKGLVHKAGRSHLLQVLDFRKSDKFIHTIVVDERGEQHEWITGAVDTVRVLITVPDATTAEVTQ